MRVRRRIAAALVVIVVALVLAHRPLLGGYARLFRVNDPAPSDALVILSDTPGAVEPFHRRLAPLVLIITDGPFPFADLNPTEVQRRVMVRRGVPAEAIRILPPVCSFPDDSQRALSVREYARTHELRRITIVASAAQTRRLRRIYRHALRGSGVDVRTAAVADPWYDEATWYTTDEGLVAYFEETAHWLVGFVSP